MVLLPTFDVTAIQRARITAALRQLTAANPSATDADVYKGWLRTTLVDTVKMAERLPLSTDYRRNVEAQDAQVDIDLGGIT